MHHRADEEGFQPDGNSNHIVHRAGILFLIKTARGNRQLKSKLESNGQVEEMFRLLKYLLRKLKGRSGSKEFGQGLLKLRNSLCEDGQSPVKKLFGGPEFDKKKRHANSRVAIANSTTVVVQDVRTKLWGNQFEDIVPRPKS